MQNYRYYVLHINPRISFLDNERVTEAERAHAKKLFGTLAEPTALKQQVSRAKKTRDYTVTSEQAQTNGHGPLAHRAIDLSAADQALVRDAIVNATNMEEVRQIEKDVQEGRLPVQVRRAKAT